MGGQRFPSRDAEIFQTLSDVLSVRMKNYVSPKQNTIKRVRVTLLHNFTLFFLLGQKNCFEFTVPDKRHTKNKVNLGLIQSFVLVDSKGETMTPVNGNISFFAGKRLQNS